MQPAELDAVQYKRTVPHECSFTIPPYIHPDVYDAQLLPDLVAKPDACSSSSSCAVLMQQQEARSSLAATVVMCSCQHGYLGSDKLEGSLAVTVVVMVCSCQLGCLCSAVCWCLAATVVD